MFVPWCEGRDGLGGAGKNKGHTEVPWKSTGSICPKVISKPGTAQWG